MGKFHLFLTDLSANDMIMAGYYLFLFFMLFSSLVYGDLMYITFSYLDI